MNSKDLYNTLHRQPFVPFRVFLKDGRLYEVRRRNQAVVCSTFLAVGVFSPGMPGKYPDYVEEVALDLIDRTEDMPATLTY